MASCQATRFLWILLTFLCGRLYWKQEMRKGDCALLTVQVVVLSTALLLALLLNLALKPSFSAKLNTVFMVIGVVGGLLFYGIGLA